MEDKNYTPLIKFSINCFKYSLIIGTILYASYIITQNSDLFYWGFMYVVLAVMLNSIMLLGLIITFFSTPERKIETIKTIGLLLINIPIASFYFWTLAIGIF